MEYYDDNFGHWEDMNDPDTGFRQECREGGEV
jgi:hypothetical protein